MAARTPATTVARLKFIVIFSLPNGFMSAAALSQMFPWDAMRQCAALVQIR